MRERSSVRAGRLGDFIFMMRENEVLASRMDVNGIPEIPLRHDRALDMPARTAVAPRGNPCRFAFFLRFPENEIERILLLLFPADFQRAETRSQIIQVLMGKLAVVPEASCRKIDGSVLFIGMPVLDQFPDHADHAVDFLRGLRMRRRGFHIHRGHILLAFLDIAVRDFLG